MPDTNANSRLEAFSDGVFAIALTLLIIDIKLPPGERYASTEDVWMALRHLLPAVFAFLLSFGIILITWFNHHATLKLIDKSCPPFMFANGAFLLTVVFVPFPTALLGEFLMSGHAAPAVVLYNAVLAAQGVGWILVTSTALNHRLARDERGVKTFTENRRNGFFAVALYSLLSAAAVWFPLSVALITTASWIVWLRLGIKIKHD